MTIVARFSRYLRASWTRADGSASPSGWRTSVPKRRLVVLAALVVALSLSRVLDFVQPAQASVTVIKGVLYETVNGVNLYLDVYEPTTAGPFAGVLTIHPSWNNGKRGQMSALSKTLAENGFVAFAADYRLGCNPNNPPPGVDPSLCGYHANTAVFDLEAAMRWIRANAATYKVDPARVGAFGASSGGGLAAHLAATGAVGDDKPEVAAGWSGQFELWFYPFSYSPKTLFGIDKEYVGCPYVGTGACPQSWRDASPISYVTTDDAPTYLANGTQEIVPLQENEDHVSALQAVGVPAFLRPVPGSGHASALGPVVVSGCCTTVQDETISFLHTYLDAIPQADEALTGTAEAAVPLGSQITYSLTVTNNGSDWATGSELTDQLPSGVSLVSATSSQGTCSGVSLIDCNLGMLPEQESATVSIVVTAQRTGQIVNTPAVSSSISDPNTGNNSASLVTSVS